MQMKNKAGQLNDMLRGVRSRTIDMDNKGGKPLEFPQGFDPAGYAAADIEKFVQQLGQEVERRQGAEAERTSSLNHQLLQVPTSHIYLLIFLYACLFYRRSRQKRNISKRHDRRRLSSRR